MGQGWCGLGHQEYNQQVSGGVQMKRSYKSDIRYLGFKAGIACAFAGSIIAVIIQIIQSMIVDPNSTGVSFAVSPLIVILGWVFSAIPAGTGGIVAGLLLQRQMRKGSLTLASAAKTGTLLAGLTAILTCGFGIWLLVFTPHNYWSLLLDEAKRGNLFSLLPIVAQIINRYIPETFAAIVTAGITGGWAQAGR